jgi:phosphate starvation-inducible protein PhoH and related proteins
MTEKWIKDLPRETALRLCGPHDRNLRALREAFGVTVSARDGNVRVSGDEKPVEEALSILDQLVAMIRCGDEIPDDFIAAAAKRRDLVTAPHSLAKWAKSDGQRQYIEAMQKNDIVLCIGPAGTGKTFLAVKMAIHCLREGRVKRLVLCRPAVEAGERLGFLPGDFYAKVHPYLRPIYDALNELLDYEQVKRYLEREIVEVAPLAYMRGRTLGNAFIILDEGQNATSAQMKMFLTRMGEGSKIVVTGDISQIDLDGEVSGLVEARTILADIPGIAWATLGRRDIVRHALVADIVEAYERLQPRRRQDGHP